MIDAATSYGPHLLAGEGFTRAVDVVPADRGAEWCCLLFWQAPIPFDPEMDPKPVLVPALVVYANEARWVVDCPDCGGAQLACRTDLRFMCVLCANEAVGGRWRPTVWPRSWDKIEAELSVRPFRNQHWTPGQTLRDLRAENTSHGLAAFR